MQLKNTRNFLHEIAEMDMPISNTVRGEQIQQTFRNKLTTQLKEALFQDCEETFNVSNEPDGILAYRTKDGVVLEIPNNSIADNVTNEFGSGAISIEMKFTIKGLEYNASDESEDYQLSLMEKQRKAEEAEKKKQEKINRTVKNRAERELKRARLVEAAMKAAMQNDNVDC